MWVWWWGTRKAHHRTQRMMRRTTTVLLFPVRWDSWIFMSFQMTIYIDKLPLRFYGGLRFRFYIIFIVYDGTYTVRRRETTPPSSFTIGIWYYILYYVIFWNTVIYFHISRKVFMLRVKYTSISNHSELE